MPNSCRTNMLSDVPAEDDSFGSHYRVAQALADLVANDVGGKSIALVGDWGSGKSTVVGFFQRILFQRNEEANHKLRVFVFDAWTHQGDPLRRTFLEKLIEFLTQEKWAVSKDWTEDLDRLSKRKEKSTTKVENVLSPWGVLFAIFALFLPLGYVLFGEFESKLLLFGKPLWLIGLVISLLPLAAGLVAAVFRGKSVFPLIIQKNEEVVRKTTIRSPDPTSIEFADVFKRLMDSTLRNPLRGLVVVIDNLDRVDPEEALSIWTTMRIFFSLEGENDKPWISRFWLMVPFDPSALERLWKIDHKNACPSSNDELVSAFVDKTFQATFRVASPILSDWKSYFLDRISESLPDHEPKSDFDIVYRLFRQWQLLKGSSPTPRDVKLFVNRLGSIHRQWCPEIGLCNQALYVVVSDRIHKPAEDLIRKDFLESPIENLVAFSEWRIDLAAIHFNVEPNKALQVLIADRIERALLEGNQSAIKELSLINGFTTICDHILEENHREWAHSQPETLAMAALALEYPHEDG